MHINRVVEPDCSIVIVAFILTKCVFEWSNTINCCGCWRVLILSLRWHHRRERMISKLKLKPETSGKYLGAATASIDSFKRTHQAHCLRLILTFLPELQPFLFLSGMFKTEVIYLMNLWNFHPLIWFSVCILPYATLSFFSFTFSIIFS